MFIGEEELFLPRRKPSSDFSSIFTTLDHGLLPFKNCFFFFKVLALRNFYNLI